MLNKVKEGTMFKLKIRLGGPKKGGQEPMAIRDPNTNDLVVSTEDIKRVTFK